MGSAHFQYSQAVEAHFFISTIALNCGMLFPRCLVCVIACVICTMLVFMATFDDRTREERIQVCFQLLLMQILQLLAIYYAEAQQRQTFVLIKAIRDEHTRASELLNSMLPHEVLSEMKVGH